MSEQKQNFNDSFSILLMDKTKTLLNRPLNKQTHFEMYQIIFSSLTDLLQNTSIEISNELANWIAQQYYFAVKINNNERLDPNIFTTVAKLENINTRQLILAAMLLKDTDMEMDLRLEITRRS